MASSKQIDPSVAVDCSDITDFERFLNKYRSLEDRIILKLNQALPTKSFAKNTEAASVICNDIETQLKGIRDVRGRLIARCIEENRQIIRLLHADPNQKARVNQAHNNLREIRNEEAIEEIVVHQTENVVHDRCRRAELN